MHITITENQYDRLLEQTEEYLITSDKASSKLTAFISGDEELSLVTYDDAYYNDPPIEYVSSRYKKGKPGGTLTIGYGHTGKEAYEGNTITNEKALELLKEDLGDAIGCVNNYTRREKEAELFYNCTY